MVEPAQSPRWLSSQGIARCLVQGQLVLLAPLSRQLPIPVGYWCLCRKLLGLLAKDPDPLFPTFESLQCRGDDLEIPQLKEILAGELLGAWALDARTMELLWKLLWRGEPRIIVEFGSGVSTLLFAVYASLMFPRKGERGYVISLETDERHKAAVEQRLIDNQLADVSKILQLSRGDCGAFELEPLKENLAGASIDLVLIDGPSGPRGCRRDTLPAVLPYCKGGTQWLMDDAFRDGELEFLRIWRDALNIKIDGIFPIGKGFAVGQVT